MTGITVEHHVSPAKLDAMHVESWATWKKPVSHFEHTYTQSEVCYILEGRAIVKPMNGEPVIIERGDLVSFPKGLSCNWEITESMEKHYILK